MRQAEKTAIMAGAATSATIREWRKHDHPGWGWVALFALVAAVDLTGAHTMSEVFEHASRRPKTAPFVVGGWAYLTLHLFGLLPAEYDLLHQMACHRGSCPHVRRR
jgi:hypothetical protein